jgi:hypothetical protein
VLTALGLSISPNATAQNPPVKSLPQLQAELTDAAVQIAREYGVSLNFSHGSVEDVERVLAKIHEHYARTRDERGLRGIGIEFAAYIVTTIEQNTGEGKWERDDPTMGEASYPFYWRGAAIFPYGWCMKRIIDGDADNVWIKYRAFVLENLKDRSDNPDNPAKN